MHFTHKTGISHWFASSGRAGGESSSKLKFNLIWKGISLAAFISCVSKTAKCLMFWSVVGVHVGAFGQFVQREGTIAFQLTGLKETAAPHVLQANSMNLISVISPDSL